jgi:hypothetical protein
VGIGNRIGVLRAALLLAAGAAGGGAALAVASVPDGNGTFHACLQLTRSGTATVPDTTTTAPNITVIDPSAGQQCNSPAGRPPQREISWNATGPQGAAGPAGAPGAPGKSVTIASGHTLTIAGGQVITVGGDPGLTITPPPLRSNATPVGTMKMGTGPGALTFKVLDVAFVNPSPASSSTRRATVKDITITKTVDKSSAKLFRFCANGKHIAQGKLTMRKAGGNGRIFLVFTFKLVAVKSIQATPSSGGGLPLETLTLSFSQQSMTSR